MDKLISSIYSPLQIKITTWWSHKHKSQAVKTSDYARAQYSSRDLTAAMVSGMLMRNESAFIGKGFFDETGNPVFKNKEQMQGLIDYYFNNGEGSLDYAPNQCGATFDAPCVNVYSQALHALPHDKYIDHPQKSYVNSYAFAYDDFLGMDGTNTQTEAKPAIVDIGDMKDRKIPFVD